MKLFISWQQISLRTHTLKLLQSSTALFHGLVGSSNIDISCADVSRQPTWLYPRCQTLSEPLPMVRSSMLSWCHCGVMMSLAIDASNTISTSTYIWSIWIFLVACSSKNTLCNLFRHHLMPHLLNNFQLSWMTLSSSFIFNTLFYSLADVAFRMTHTDPIWCFKADTHSTVHVILRVPNLPGDNPQQSEEASHMGGNASRKSRKSMKGGPLRLLNPMAVTMNFTR